MHERLRPIVQVYCESLAEQVAVLARMASQTDLAGVLTSDACVALRDTGHRMAGTAHSIGFPELGAVVGELEAQAQALILAPASARLMGGRDINATIERIRALAARMQPEDSRLWNAHAAAPPAKHFGAFADSVLADAVVLVADDDLIVRQLVRTVLVDAGAKLTVLAADGKSALKECYPKQPSVVIADWRMAPMNGLELLSAIRNGYTHMRADTPFVLLTRENERDALRVALAAGVDYFLIKPFTRISLLRAVKIARERHAVARERFERDQVAAIDADAARHEGRPDT